MNDTLKVAGRIGAELGAAKAENNTLRGLLEAALYYVPSNKTELRTLIDAALSQQPEPTDTYTAVDMATAAAQGFRDWHKAEPAPAQDEMVVYRAVNQFGSDCHFGIESLARVWAGAKGSVERVALKPVPELSLVESRPAQDEREAFEAWWKTHPLGDSVDPNDPAAKRNAREVWLARASRPAQTAPQGKFRMGDLVKKSTGSEWEGRVVGWYSTEQTKEGYAVESSAHRNSVQIYPVTALEAVE